MADKYYRLVSLVVNICPHPLRELFHLCAHTDTQFTGPYTSQGYLQFRRSDITRALATKTIRRDQYNKVYPTTGQTDISDWDTTLLIAILKVLFTGTLTGTVLNHTEKVRDCRNDLQHISTTANVSDAEFNQKWGDLEAATVALANNAKGAVYAADIQKKINSAKTSHMPDLGDVLCEWYKENTLRLENKVDTLENKVDTLQKEVTLLTGKLENVSKDTQHTKSILDKGTRKTVNSLGKSIKRFKTEDLQLTIMQRRFSDTMRHYLPSDTPTTFVELPTITQKLREYHFVVVCGSSRSLYIQAALASIKKMGYTEGRCFELSKASDWWHVTFEEADCIVVVNPFGKITFDHQKASVISEIMDRMLSATKDEKYRDFSFRDIVIISNAEMLTEYEKYFQRSMPKITILDNSHILARKGRHSVSLPSTISEADTYDNVVAKEWRFIKELNAKFESERACYINGMCMVPPNELAMTDQENKSLKLVSISDGRLSDRKTFSTIPTCPTLLPQDTLAVLLCDEGIIQLYTIYIVLKQRNAIRLNGRCNSIIFENDVFFAFFYPAEVKTLNMQGEELSTTVLESDIQGMNIDLFRTDICPEKTSFYISDSEKTLLLRVNREGQMMTMYSGLNHIGGILAMADGSVYVCDKETRSVLQMTADFTRPCVVLGPSDNVVAPSNLCYWPEENIMFVFSASKNPTYRDNLKMFSLST